MNLPLKWEFPGGKIDPGESPEQCLVRELQEELLICVQVERQLPVSTHHYPSVTVTLHPFVCTMAAGHADPQEHDMVTWFTPEELRTLDWAAADVPVLATYLARRRKNAR
jgi:8-oxo-dGTP diphosphatase